MRTIAENTLLFPIGKMSDQLQGAIVLNELSQYVWELLGIPKSEEEVVAAVVDSYEVSPPIAQQHIHDLISNFEKYRVIQRNSTEDVS